VVEAWSGRARFGGAWRGGRGEAVEVGLALQGRVWGGGHGGAWVGMVRPVLVPQVAAVMAGRGMAGYGKARPGMVRRS